MLLPSAKTPIQAAKKILVMRYRFIGDMVLMIPFLRNLRRACPDAMIDVLVAPNSGEILTHCPYINELIVFDTSRRHRYEQTEGGEHLKKQSFLTVAKTLRNRHYDWCFVLKRSFSSALLALLANIPNRAGFATEGRHLLLTHRVPYFGSGHPKVTHERDAFLAVLQSVGIAVTDRHLEGWFSQADEQIAMKRLEQSSPAGAVSIVVHLTSSNPAKQWPEKHAVVFLEHLLSYASVAVHCLGTVADRQVYEVLKARLSLSVQHRLHIHCGQFSLLESLAFLKRVCCVVGVDSGTLHMAASVGTPVIALFGPMDEKQWAPVGSTVLSQIMDCRPCHLKHPCTNDFNCMGDMLPKTVMEALKARVNLV